MRKFKVTYKDFDGRERIAYDELKAPKLSGWECRELIATDWMLHNPDCDMVIKVEEVC